MENKTSDIIIKAYEGWLETINPNYFTITTSKGKQNAKDILNRMKDPNDAFGQNFKKSIYQIVSTIISGESKEIKVPSHVDDKKNDFVIETYDDNDQVIQHAGEQVIKEINGKSKFGEELNEAIIQTMIKQLFSKM